MIWIVIAVLATGFSLSAYIFIRNQLVLNFRRRLSMDEMEWLRQDTNFNKAVRHGKGLALRFNSLPPYDHMMIQFWKPLSRYAKQLKPIEEYYK